MPLVIERTEGCTKAKLSQFSVVVEPRMLMSFTEVRRATFNVAADCRFCQEPVPSGSGVPGVHPCCGEQFCIKLSERSCTRILPCGHACLGVAGEETCLPCLYGCAAEDNAAPKLLQRHDDECMTCFTGALSMEPCVRLHCGHVHHLGCMRRLLELRWSGPRI
eukprot:UC1_evm1s1281